jgi:putative flippase GtrA
MTSSTYRSPSGGRILTFGLVGVVGFVVDSALLAATIGFIGPYWGRAVSFVAAVLTTWAFNRNITFRDRPSRYSPGVELGRYFAAMCIGGAVNYAVYAALLGIVGAEGLAPFAALAVGSLAGMTVNLLLAHHTVFKP